MRTLCWSACLLLAATGILFAGEDAHVFTASTAREMKTAEEKEDIGDIEPEGAKGLASYFYGNAQGQLQYTTNANLRGDHSSSDGLFLPTLQGGFAFPLADTFSLDLVGRLDSALYADHDDRAFWGASVTSTLNWRPAPKLPRIYVSAEPYYFQSFDDGDRLAEAIALTAGIEHNIVLNRGYTMLFGGYSYSHYFAHPSPDDRNVNRFILGVTQQFHPRLYAQLFYSFQYSAYESNDRNDLRQVAGLNLTWQFTSRLFGTLNSSFADNDSSVGFASYQSAVVGAGLTLQF